MSSTRDSGGWAGYTHSAETTIGAEMFRQLSCELNRAVPFNSSHIR